MSHIREKLPDMKARLNTLMGQTQQELNAFGDATFLGEQHRVCSFSQTSDDADQSGLAYPKAYDRVLPRLCLFDRRYLARDIDQGALRRRENLLHFQRGLWTCPPLDRSHTQSITF